jgi:hypothetical protein
MPRIFMVKIYRVPQSLAMEFRLAAEACVAPSG